MKQDIFEQYKKAVTEQEKQEVTNREALWDRLEEKLDGEKKKKRVLPLWARLGAVASVVLLVGVFGVWFSNMNTSKLHPGNAQVKTNEIKVKDRQPRPLDSQKESVKTQEAGVEKQQSGDTGDTSKQSNDISKHVPTLVPQEDQPIDVKKAVNQTKTRVVNKPVVSQEVNSPKVQSFMPVTKEQAAQMNTPLGASDNQIEEVTVVGYGVQQQQTFSGAASVVTNSASNSEYKGRAIVDKNAEPLNEIQYNNVSQALQGQVAGLQIQNSPPTFMPTNVNGTPSTAAKVRIRSVSSINNGNEPLYVVDGVPMPMAAIKVLAPEEIKEVTVLKDASATAIYGSRGSNGVIVIQTKDLTPKQRRKLRKANKKKKLESKNHLLPFYEPDPIIVNVSNEDYESFVENQFESPRNAPLSTFSVDVDRASYANIRRFLNMGQSVPKDAVRIEEMVNYFNYEYEQPRGEDPIAIHTEYSDAPWNKTHKLLKIGIQGKELDKENIPPSNIVFLIDVSGSMSSQNKLPLLKSSIELLIEELSDEDKVSIVVYAGAAGVVLEPTNDKEEIKKALRKLNAGGSTAGGEGIELAYKIAEENFIKDGNNRVILATDGDFNVGASSNDAMEKLIEKKRETGIFLTCLGYGMGNYQDSKMEILADKGNGNYAYIDNLQEANKTLVEEFSGTMFTIAKDVKVQIEFNPKHVQSYRLIGYENRKLRPEDFTNDAIDAGEMGAGHTVTALYEIIPTGVASEFLQESPALKYSEVKPSATNYSDELATVKFRYKQPDGDKSKEIAEVIANRAKPMAKTSEDFKFAAAVAWFGLKLRDSKLVSNKSTEDIVALAKKGKGNDEEGYRGEMIRLAGMVK